MAPLKSQKRFLLSLINYVSPSVGTFMMSFMPCSYHPIMKQQHTDLTIPDHPRILSREKKNMRSRRSLITNILGGLEPSSTLSNGRVTLKQITPGNQLTRSMLQSLLKPITDNTLSKIKGSKDAARRVSTPSPTS